MKLKRTARISLFVTAMIVVVLGAIVADTATKPLTIQLRAHIQVCKKDDKGAWTVVDEIGPSNLQFRASLAELAAGKKIQSDFVWNAKSKNGQDYSVKLAEPANIDFDVKSGKLEGDLKYDITWRGKKAIVPAHISTESLNTPLGSRVGKRARGILGLEQSTFTLVSANDLQIAGEATPLKLVCTEEYTFSPAR